MGRRREWLGAELRHLAALEAIAEEGSFRAAAQRLAYAQSAVSQQVAKLEGIVGVPLVERGPGFRSVALTPAGERLLPHACGILAQIRAAETDLDRLDDDRVRIGAYDSVATRLLPSMLKATARMGAGVAVTPVDCPTDASVFASVRDGQIDLGFSYLPLEPGPFAWEELTRSPIVLVVAATSPLARAKDVPTLDELARLPLIACRGCRGVARIAKHGLASAHGSLNVVLGSELTQSTLALVAAGVGVALMPLFAVRPDDERITIIELDDQLPSVGVGVFWHRYRVLSPAVERLRDLARDVCADSSPVEDAALAACA